MKSTLLLLGIIATVPACLAQDQTANLGYNPQSYFQINDMDDVNLVNGNLVLHIPIISYPQKGSTPPFSLSVMYNGLAWSIFDTYDDLGAETQFWSYTGMGAQVVRDNVLGNFYESTPDGIGEYQYAIDSSGSIHGYLAASSASGAPWRTNDGSNVLLNSTYMVDSQGITHSNPSDGLYNGSTGGVDLTGSYYDTTTDQDGNSITPTYSSGVLTGWDDTLGRSIPAPPFDVTSSGCTTKNYPGIGGGSESIQFCYASYSVTSPSGIVGGAVAYSNTLYLLHQIVLPNGNTWTFDYDSYGDLQTITLPTGGTITYGWTTTPLCGSDVDSYGQIVTSRSVNDGTGAHTWNYAYNVNSAGATVVTDPLSNDTVSTNTYAAGPCLPNIGSKVYYAGSYTSGTKIKEEDTGYADYASPWGTTVDQIFPASKTTIYPVGSSTVQSEIAYQYDSPQTWYSMVESAGVIYYYASPLIMGSVTDEKDYDFGAGAPGSLLREKEPTYEWQASSSYFNANLLNLPASVTLTDGTNSTTTNYTYDESAYYSGSGLGHLTTTNPLSGVYTHTAWNGSGQMTGSKDAAGNTTTYGYSSGIAGPTSIAYPLIGTEYYGYDGDTGSVTSHTDVNGKTTTYTYDSMDRPWAVQYPDTSSGQSEIVCYPSATSVTVYQAQGSALTLPGSSSSCPSSSTAVVKTTNYDGMGRTISTLVSSAPEGTIETDTTYDALGRVYTVSNPYVGTPSGYTTTYPYDALSRPLTVTEQDGSTKTWSYTGNATVATDENGSETETVADGLGRISSVYEPTALHTAPTLPTTYSYNVYGLTGVTQTGNGTTETPRTRSFSYDSLSRLTSATNPEAGTVTYTYPVSSSLCAGDLSLPCTTTDARGITTSYTYDALNRLTGKTHSGSSGTLRSCYQYGVSGTSATNGIGRLFNEWTQTGSSCASPSGIGTVHSIVAYDVLGRIKNEKQCILTICSSSTPPTVGYNYDLAGNTTSYTNGMIGSSTPGTISFANQFDGAGRLLSLTSSWDDSAHPGLLFSSPSYSPPSGSTYNPAGLTSVDVGNHLNLQRTYDPRLRVNSETVLAH